MAKCGPENFYSSFAYGYLSNQIRFKSIFVSFSFVLSQDPHGDCVHAERPDVASRPAESRPLPNARGGNRSQEEVGGGNEREAATASLVERSRGNFHLNQYFNILKDAVRLSQIYIIYMYEMSTVFDCHIAIAKLCSFFPKLNPFPATKETSKKLML